eukprot:CAMPEP_0117789156 /NCGR_PEP_ID=MMETSP0948-20121206/7473_1 /TAXON_ID=44440 /ORGANISM="Chattonella subsalsa, Strain CCMP2191" /LENGTH=203 /DNA_ID=CAMNT_0005618723 /DNA_START=118 /DNA_END=726 /DNA_ORIENTATION=-
MAFLNNSKIINLPELSYIEDEVSAVNLSNESLHFANTLFNASPDYDLTWSFETDQFDIRLYTRAIMDSKINLTYSIIEIDRPAEVVFEYLRHNFLTPLFQHNKVFDSTKMMSASIGDKLLLTHATSYEGFAWAYREWCQLHTTDSRNMQIISTSCLSKDYNNASGGFFQYFLPVGTIPAREFYSMRVTKGSSEHNCKVLGLRW